MGALQSRSREGIWGELGFIDMHSFFIESETLQKVKTQWPPKAVCYQTQASGVL